MKSARIFVPPGIGDGYWVLAKLRGFMASRGIKSATIYVHDAGPRRSGDMWSNSFVRFGGYRKVPKSRMVRLILDRGYRQAGFPVQQRVLGFDYFISLNGSLEHGQTLDQALPGPTDWYEPLDRPEETERSADSWRARFGEYIAVGIWSHGFYQKWIDRFSEANVVSTLRHLADAGRKVVLMGAEWDRGGLAERVAAQDDRFVNLVSQTSFADLCGLLAGASGVFGFPAGNTLIAPRFRVPTVIMWTSHFARTFWSSACAPDPAFYRYVDGETATPASVAGELLSMSGAPA